MLSPPPTLRLLSLLLLVPGLALRVTAENTSLVPRRPSRALVSKACASWETRPTHCLGLAPPSAHLLHLSFQDDSWSPSRTTGSSLSPSSPRSLLTGTVSRVPAGHLPTCSQLLLVALGSKGP